MVRKSIQYGSLIALPAIVVGGWVLWRNWNLYGDITASGPFIQIAGGDRGYSIFDVLGESSGLWSSIFAVLGWFNVRAPQWVYIIWNLIVLLSVIGVGLSLVLNWTFKRETGEADTPGKRARFLSRLLRRPESTDWPGAPALLLGLWVLLVYGGLIVFAMRTPASQGRLLFPAILPLALALGYGMSQYRWRGVSIVALLLALTTTVYCLFFVIPTAYARPQPISRSEIPPEAIALNRDLGQELELLAYQLETSIAKPGDLVWLTLYWRSSSALDEISDQDAPEYVLELFGRDDQLVGKVQSYHGGGLYPSTLWRSGDVIVDRLAVRLDKDLAAPVQARLIIKLSGREESAGAGEVKIAPSNWPEMSEVILAHFNGLEITETFLGLETAAPRDVIPIRVRWQVRIPTGQELTTFVHLGDPSQDPLAQGDSPPIDGHYPTDLWEEGEVIDDSYDIILPPDITPGRYPVYIGLYDPVSGLRLPLFIEEQRQLNDAYLLGWIFVR